MTDITNNKSFVRFTRDLRKLYDLFAAVGGLESDYDPRRRAEADPAHRSWVDESSPDDVTRRT
ncbi:MAG TPA: hypothetical protein PKE20_08505 [Promineifilum sp.]|nr:hypothetical protein [Promineifilum sp.]